MSYSAKVLGENLSRELLFMRSDNRPMAEVTNRLIQVYVDHGEVAGILKSRIAALESDNSKLRAAAKVMRETLGELLKQEHERGGSLGSNGYFHYKISGHVFKWAQLAIEAYDAAIGEDGG